MSELLDNRLVADEAAILYCTASRRRNVVPRALPITAPLPLLLPHIALRLTREHRDRSDAVSTEQMVVFGAGHGGHVRTEQLKAGWDRDRIVAALTAEGIPCASERPPCG